MKSDIEIARSIELTKIKQVACNFGMPLEYVTHYGRYMAKVSWSTSLIMVVTWPKYLKKSLMMKK